MIPEASQDFREANRRALMGDSRGAVIFAWRLVDEELSRLDLFIDSTRVSTDTDGRLNRLANFYHFDHSQQGFSTGLRNLRNSITHADPFPSLTALAADT